VIVVSIQGALCPTHAELPAAAHAYSEEAAGNQLSFIAFKQVPWHHYARLAVEQSQITIRSPFLDNDLVALAFQAPSEATELWTFRRARGGQWLLSAIQQT